MAGTLQIGGLISGLDTNAIIDALVGVEQTKITIVEQQQASVQLKLSAYGSLISRINDFGSAATKISDPTHFDLFQSSSSDDTYATIEGGAGAIPGEYSLIISQRAAAEKLTSLAGRISDSNAALLSSGGSATVSINGVSIDIDDNDTVLDLAMKINNAKDGDGEKLPVQATLIKAGTDDYRLVISSTKEGIENGLELSDTLGSVLQDLGIILDASGSKGNVSQSYSFTSGLPLPQTGAMGANGMFSFTGTDHNGNTLTGDFTLTGKTTEELTAFIESAFNQTVDAAVDAGGNLIITDKTTGQSQFDITVTDSGTVGLGAATVTTGVTGASSVTVAKDAFFSVNGIAVQNGSNNADDVVSGITFNLLKADPDTEVTLEITRDYEQVKGVVQEFIDSYNAVIGYIGDNNKFSYTTEPGQKKEGKDGAFTSDWTVARVKNDLRNVVSTQFNQWGTGAIYNTLSRLGITSDAKTGKLSIDDEKFEKAFDDDFDQVVRLFTPYGASTDANVVLGRTTEDTESNKYYLRRIDDTQWEISTDQVNWTASDARVGDVISWSSGTANGLSLTIPTTVTDPLEFTFTKGIGELMAEAADRIGDGHDGYLSQGQDNLQSSINRYNTRIDTLNVALENFRERLVKQYSALEQTMNNIKTQQTALTNALAQLS
jgi:flagellar hook-associated protein 2